jgi:hypothetical protein
MCTHRAGDWMLGRHSVLALAAMSVMWIGKALHLQVMGWWPGPQHFPAQVRILRDKPDEYCGCGSTRRYGHCCRDADMQRSRNETARELVLAEASYRVDIAKRGWPPRCPVSPGIERTGPEVKTRNELSA